MTIPNSFFDWTLEQVQEELQAEGIPAYRALQLWQGVYQQLVDSPTAISNLPRELREQWSQRFSLASLETKAIQRSTDRQTEKWLLGLVDGNAVETVLMRYRRRRTACISTQVGCAMGCPFCATGQMGFRRNLSRGEIVEQVITIARYLRQQGDRLTNVVVMGMGEPFQNYEATLGAIQILNDSRGFNMGARRFTISTVGWLPGIERFTEERHQINLAVSLHAATDSLRDELLPVNRRYPLGKLIPACRRYAALTRRRITFEWALIQDINDGLDQAEALAHWVEGMLCHVNLIPLNPTQAYAGKPSDERQVLAFLERLRKHGISASVRLRRGIDIQAGCGQLAAA